MALCTFNMKNICTFIKMQSMRPIGLRALSYTRALRGTDTFDTLPPSIYEDDEQHLPQYITINTPVDITPLTGVPQGHIKDRKVMIKVPTKNAMQSGTNNMHRWSISFDTQERWENPLMGWSSTADPLSNLEVDFANADEAIAFCEKNGWAWELQEPPQKTPRAKSYAANFSWNKRTRRSAK